MKTLFLALEAAPAISYVWRLRENYIPVEHLVQPGYTLCWAARWGGEKEVMFDSVKKSGAARMTRRIHKLLDEADAVVTYNGKSYDIPTLEKDFLRQRLTPPAPFAQIDLYQTAKRFNFISRKLNFITKQLDLGERVKHRGMDLWTDCMKGDAKAFKEMEGYNKQDVVLLERAYEILKPWIKGHPNRAIYTDGESPVCRICGSSNLTRRGKAPTTVGLYQRYQCECGAWSRGSTNLLTPEKRKAILRT